MATLKAMFKLFDGYSTTIDKINRKTDEATDKILKASRGTDTFNSKLEATGASANRASLGLGKFISIAALIAGAMKGMNITDEFMNTSARLSLINDGLQTQAELQDKIFAAAERSRGSYSSMANAVAKMGLLAGENFKSNDELIAFTELVQKSFKVGGASATEQSSALLQLTQAMASGRLQGDEFRAITENAPLIANAIAKYTGKSKGELKKMSAEGTITADIIKNALFTAADDINTKFKTLPMTFVDVWNKIKNSATRAFEGVMESINKVINTNGFQDFLKKMTVGFELVAEAAEWIVNTVVAGWDTIGPILGVIGGILLVNIIRKLILMIPLWAANAIGILKMTWPILLVIGVIAIAISAARQFGATWEQILGVVGGIVGVFAAFCYNQFVWIWNAVAAFVNFFGNVFKHPIASIKALFYDLASTVLGYIAKMAQGIEDLLNKIPFVKVNITSGIERLQNKLKKDSDTIKTEAEWTEYMKTKDFMDYSEGYTKGSNIGKSIPDKINGAVDKATEFLKGNKGFDFSQFGTPNNPVTVDGTGKNKKVDVDMSKEDLQYLRDIAEREYINKFSTATLAPNITVQFGDIHEEADANKVAGRIKKILQEEIATAAEGAY
ncbi:tape measure protein [Sporanaerobacter sp. PP17-6a]|uniref:tape measure protein n=1 Tax=Sporanaerobacter sp. PP17-6a TaxID=1891289 RepID=UPI00089FA73B|nr:tape measure protein [Sporanaerobacter sp. PP17-6a]SCL85123.1 tape measure domain protein [Sporanaerobacter sp. PP17-6a]